MSIYAAPGLTYEASASNFPTGLTGTIGVRVTDGIGGTTTSRTTSGIAEFPAGSGIYTVTLTAPTSAGQYQVVWDSGGGSPTWATEELVVTSSSPGGSTPSGIDLCTLSDVREALELPASDTTRDALIQTLITGMSQAINREYEREFSPATGSATRRFQIPAGSLILDLTPYDLRTVSSLKLNPDIDGGSTLTASIDFQLTPVVNPQGPYQGVRFSNRVSSLHSSQTAMDFGYTLCDIAGAWGFASVPEDVRRACVIAVQSALRRDLTELAIAGIEEPQSFSPEGPATHALPAASRRLLAPFRRTAGVF